MRALTILSLLLVVIGALNWGLVGLFSFNVVNWIFGHGVLSRIVYVVVGLAGLFGISVLATLASSPKDVCVPGSETLVTQH